MGSSSLWAREGIAQETPWRDRGSVGQMEQGQARGAPNPNLPLPQDPLPKSSALLPETGGVRALV